MIIDLKHFIIITLFLAGISHRVFADNGDTLVVHPISFETPSPEGWNVQYKTIAEFPDDERTWAKIIMVQTLKCDALTKGDKYPCGEWDYIWHTKINIPEGDTVEPFCIGSFVTPYGKRLYLGGENGWTWFYDITDYAPILKGKKELITGNNLELLDLKFLFIEGIPPRNVLSVENFYPFGRYKYEHLADDSVLKKKEILLNSDAKTFMLKARISGHGHAGPRNCCEWDSKTHTYYIKEDYRFRWNVWKDCGFNPIYPQGGTWPFDRAGWCPGTKVDEYDFELTQYVKPGDTLQIDYGIEYYSDNGEKDGEFDMTHQLFTYGDYNFTYDAAIEDVIKPSSKDEYSRINPDCNEVQIKIKNQGMVPLKQLTIRYGFGGSEQEMVIWHGNLNFNETETVTLPYYSKFHLKETAIFNVSISRPNGQIDENDFNNHHAETVNNPIVLPRNFVVHIETNNLDRARENKLVITNSQGNIMHNKLDFSDDCTYNEKISLPSGSDCYSLRFTDDMEDGISIHWWYYNSNPEMVGKAGKVVILENDSENAKTLYEFPSDFGQELLINFRVSD
jgi:hypothetical protein